MSTTSRGRPAAQVQCTREASGPPGLKDPGTEPGKAPEFPIPSGREHGDQSGQPGPPLPAQGRLQSSATSGFDIDGNLDANCVGLFHVPSTGFESKCELIETQTQDI